MKIIVAQSLVASDHFLEPIVAQLSNAFTEAGHEVQRFDVPGLADDDAALPALVSHRLMRLDPWCDAVICLDPLTSILRHPRKYVWLLGTDLLDCVSGVEDSRWEFIAKILRNALEEAAALFIASKSVRKAMANLGVASARHLEPAVTLGCEIQVRGAGGELLVAEPLVENSRLELLLDSLLMLPASCRIRWIAPSPDPAALLRAQRLVEAKGLESRVTIDPRPVGREELCYLMGSATALITLEAGAAVLKPHLRSAMNANIPVVGCRDGGAITAVGSARPSVQIVDADANSLSEAVTGILANPRTKKRGAPPPAADWSPLLKELVS